MRKFEDQPENSGMEFAKTDAGTDFAEINPSEAIRLSEKDPLFKTQVQRLHRLTVYSRWLFVGLLWLVLAPISLWNLRGELVLLQDYFTWTAVRYAIIYNRLPALGLIFCVGVTVSVLIWQSRNILWGPPEDYLNYLERQVLRIRRQGKSHPLWRWVCHS